MTLFHPRLFAILLLALLAPHLVAAVPNNIVRADFSNAVAPNTNSASGGILMFNGGVAMAMSPSHQNLVASGSPSIPLDNHSEPIKHLMTGLRMMSSHRFTRRSIRLDLVLQVESLKLAAPSRAVVWHFVTSG